MLGNNFMNPSTNYNPQLAGAAAGGVNKPLSSTSSVNYNSSKSFTSSAVAPSTGNLSSVGSLLLQLIKKQVATSKTSGEQYGHLIAYCSRLLNSRLIPHLNGTDLLSMQDMLKKKCMKSSPVTADAVKLSKMLDALAADSVHLQQKFAVMYFLYSLAYSGSSLAGVSLSLGTGLISGSTDLVSFEVGSSSMSTSSFHQDSLLTQLQQQPNMSLLSLTENPSVPGLSQSVSQFPSTANTTMSHHVNKSQYLSVTPAIRERASQPNLSQSRSDMFTTPSQSMSQIYSAPSQLQAKKSLSVVSGKLEVTVRDILNAFQQTTTETVTLDPKGFYVTTSGNRMANDILLVPSLFKQIGRLLDERSEKSLLHQTLNSCIQADIMQYHELVAKIEQYVNDLTLIRLYSWTRPVALVMDSIARLLSVVNQKMPSSDSRANILDVLYRFSLHGDAAVRKLYSRYLNECSGTLFTIVTKYIMTGIVNDPFNEFFCAMQKNAASIWNSVVLIESRIPSFISKDFANSIFVLGKSRHFLALLAPSTTAQITSDEHETKFKFENMNRLKALIAKESKYVNKMLMDTLQNKYSVFDNFNAIKNYLLMGYGDFVHEMLCSLSEELDKDASVLMRHILVQKMEDCLRASRAQHDPEHVLGAVDVRLLEAQDGDLGWDVFSLDYRIDRSMSVLFGEDLMLLYLRLFNFLWRLKRSRFVSGRVWRRMTKCCPLIDYGVLRSFGVFLGIIEDYVMTDVVEKHWQEFEAAVKVSDFDNLMRIHSEYCKKICSGLFGNNGEIVRLLLSIFKDCVSYCAVLERVCDLHEKYNATLKQHDESKEQTKDGWGSSYASDMKLAESKASVTAEMKTVYGKLNKVQREFESKMGDFIRILLKSDDLASLGFRLDFNNFYKTDAQ